MMRLPTMIFSLPRWRDSDFQSFSRSTLSLVTLASKAGHTSDRFKAALIRIRSTALSGHSKSVSRTIRTAIDVRAATYLLSTDSEFVGSGVLNRDFTESLQNSSPHLSRLSLLHLVRAYFVFFDHLGNQQELWHLAELIKDQLAFRGGVRGENTFIRLARYKDVVFEVEGPTNVVRQALEKRRSLEEQFEHLSLTGYGRGRYHSICRYRFYLQTLKEIPVGSDHEVLREVTRGDVYKAPGSHKGMLGHEVLEILIDRSSSQQVSDIWRGVILTIAGDPRIRKSNSRYQQWWALLGEDRVQKVRGWLSRLDLNLFLRVLQDYGQAKGDVDLQRMFPARKKFLEGLIEQDLVVTSRLFVGNQARNYLHRNFKREELPAYAVVHDTYRSMIYLQVDHCHMIEGSHSFKLWIFPKLPSATVIVNYDINDFYPHQLGSRTRDLYLSEFGANPYRPAEIRHTPNGLRWQHKAISYLEQQGIRLDVEKLFSRDDYRQYKRLYGVRAWAG